LHPFLDRPLAQVDPVERAILRIGGYELMQRPDIPYRIIINEAVELAKLFGAEQGHRFINGVLDKLAHVVRKAEFPPRS
jgi:N utilization substance protein B